MWQDYVFAAGSVLFSLSLLPSFRGNNRPAVSTCLQTGGVLLAYVVADLTLGLIYAGFTTLTTAVIWLLLVPRKK